MRVFRRHKLNLHPNRDGASGKEPLPDIVYQLGAEAAARYVAQNPYGPNIIYGSRGRFDAPPPYLHVAVPVPEDNLSDGMDESEFDSDVRAGSPLNLLRTALRLNRSGSNDRFAEGSFAPRSRPGSPQQFGRRSRAASPELMQARAGSPYLFSEPAARVGSPLHFRTQTRSSSPETFRRLQRAQLSQDLQRAEREQKRKQRESMIAAYPFQLMPQYQQVPQTFYPTMSYNGNPWHMMQQPSTYPYF